jgi:hypothetical protein
MQVHAGTDSFCLVVMEFVHGSTFALEVSGSGESGSSDNGDSEYGSSENGIGDVSLSEGGGGCGGGGGGGGLLVSLGGDWPSDGASLVGDGTGLSGGTSLDVVPGVLGVLGCGESLVGGGGWLVPLESGGGGGGVMDDGSLGPAALGSLA